MTNVEIAPAAGLKRFADGHMRCWWCTSAPDGMSYHDGEWGLPVADDFRLFEKICLEGFRSGLSWLTILRRRENFRRAFRGFDYRAVAAFTGEDLRRLLGNTGIVRHRAKIDSAVNNARRACELADEEGSLARYFWRFEPDAGQRPAAINRSVLMNMNSTPESEAMARDLKRRGWSFIGPISAYSFMQSMGIVNDHVDGCEVRDEVERQRTAFERP